MQLTPRSQEIFMEFAKDAGNWSGMPWIDCGNIEINGKEDRGNLSDLVQKGLITIHQDEGVGRKISQFIRFTETGKTYAKENGVIIE
jgi:hypothetical protein